MKVEAGAGGSGQHQALSPATQRDLDAAAELVQNTVDPVFLQQLLQNVLSAAQANAQLAPTRDRPACNPTPEVMLVSDTDTRPSAREQLAAIRTEVQANDAPKLTAPHEQHEQLDEGTLMLLDVALNALEANEPLPNVAIECLKIAQRRLKCYSVALAKAGPGANGNFAAPYEIWHGKRRNFAKPEFKPEAIDKGDIESALAKTRKSGTGDKDGGTARHGGLRDFCAYGRQPDCNRYDRSERRTSRNRSRSRSPVKR